MSNQTLSPRDFIVWQQAIFEMIGDRAPTEVEWKMIREKHDLVFGAVLITEVADRLEAEKRRNMQAAMLEKIQQPTYRGMVGGIASGSVTNTTGYSNSASLMALAEAASNA